MQLAQTRPFDPGRGEVRDGVATIKGLEAIFSNVVVVALGFGGIVLFLMLVLGGFHYLTSGGDPQKVDSAKKTLTLAIGGFILLVMAFLILKFIESFTGLKLTEFKVVI